MPRTHAERADDVIELLPPNEHAFGAAETATFVGVDGDTDEAFDDEEPRPRWTTAMAGLLVTGLVAVAVVAVATSDGGESSSPTTTPAPVTPTTGVPASPPTTAPADTAQPGPFDPSAASTPPPYLLSDPAPLHLRQAWTDGSSLDTSNADVRDWFVLWATPGAARTTGRWLAATTLRSSAASERFHVNGRRVTAGLDTGVLTIEPDGVTSLDFTSTDGINMEIGGFGVATDDLIAIASEITGTSGRIDSGDTARRVRSGMAAVVAGEVPSGGLSPLNLFAGASTGVFYGADDGSSSIQLRLASATPDSRVVDFLMAPSPDGDAGAEALADMERQVGFVRMGVDPDQPHVRIVVWASMRGWTVASSVGTSAAAFIQQLAALRVPTDDEWADLLDRSAHDALSSGADADAYDMAIVGGGKGEDGRWQASMSTGPARLFYLMSPTSVWADATSEPTADPTLLTVASTKATYLIGIVSADGAARQMSVSVPGSDPVVVSMKQAGDSFAGAYAYSELADAAVTFLDADGNPVDVVSPPA